MKGVVACVTKHVPIPKIMCHVSMTGSSSYSGRFGQHLVGRQTWPSGSQQPPPLFLTVLRWVHSSPLKVHDFGHDMYECL